jgi:hypothetical protein
MTKPASARDAHKAATIVAAAHKPIFIPLRISISPGALHRR